MQKQFATPYQPMYFLASLGNGGMAVASFLYLNFLVKHPDTPIVTFDHLAKAVNESGMLVSGLIVAMLGAVLFFVVNHLRLLVRNVRAFREYRKTDAFAKLRKSNAEVSLMAMPLTYAMSVNVAFIAGALYVPGLWSVVEYLFPLALLAFLAIGIYALRIFADYAGRLIAEGGFDFSANNSLSQLIAAMSLAMVAVGFSSPAAMSHSKVITAIGAFGTIFFGMFSLSLIFVNGVLGFKSILRHGISREASPSLWAIIPTLTVLGIAAFRLTSGIFHNFVGSAPPAPFLFVLLTLVLGLQLAAGFVGYTVMKRLKYFEDYVNGSAKSAASYSLVCPGVGLTVMGLFFVSWGLVKNGIITQYSLAHGLAILPFALLQLKTLQVMFKLNRKLLSSPSDALAQPVMMPDGLGQNS